MFPNHATESEKSYSWPIIATLTDADFGFTDLEVKPDTIRFAARIILQNEQGQISIIRSGKHGYAQLPGGGIEPSETIVQGLRRETIEESGYEITDIKPLGRLVEIRESIRNHRAKTRISFVFTARPTQHVGTHYMPDELEEQYSPKWIAPDVLIAELKSCIGNINSYGGNFANLRDLNILKYWQKKA